jgi:tRNA A-37 threonylcarbamoyl transferase component Bud32
MPDLSIRLRDATLDLLQLPWPKRLASWQPDEADLRELPVGPSRHVVRFVQADSILYALKELPTRVASKEYRVLRELEARQLPSVRAVGVVDQPEGGNSILVTEYLANSWQYRRLFQRLPRMTKHRDRLLDAMASLLVDLHRRGVFWGDCSLANTLFKRDGQALQAFLVDAETSEIHPTLSDGQRALDLGILVENVTGDLLDLAVAMGEGSEHVDEDLAAAQSVATRYESLWEELTREETFGVDERYKVVARVRRLNELGFAVDEVALEPAGEQPDDGRSKLRLKVAVANRRFHAGELRRLTGLEVGEGQATILLNDLRAYQGRLEQAQPGSTDDATIGLRWLHDCFRPAVAAVTPVMPPGTDPVQAFYDHKATLFTQAHIQAYCDLLEVRWLLSEQAGRDVGDDVALAALAGRQAPSESAAQLAVVEMPTEPFRAIRPGVEPGAGDAGNTS